MQRANRSVSEKQLQLLYEVYRYRFITVGLLAYKLHLRSANALRDRLDLLCTAGYLEKLYRPEYRLQGRGAIYYVRPEARNILQQLPTVSAAGLQSIYKLPTLSESFRDHCLKILGQSAALDEQYPDCLSQYTKPEMLAYDYFMRPLPDLFIVKKQPDEARKYFFIEWCGASVPASVLAQRVLHYDDYIAGGAWEVTKLPDPSVIIVCATHAQMAAAVQRRELLHYDESSPDIRILFVDQPIELT